jgi:uncharacterized protein YlxW (UPF0749 family)
MRIRLVNISFIVIGVIIGSILALQIRAKPVNVGSYPLDQLEVQRSLLTAFSSEQDVLKKSLATIEQKLEEEKTFLEKISSKETKNELARLKSLTGLDVVEGEGIKITLKDNSTFSRTDFSAVNENFVQATDLRDLVNLLFLQDAKAIAINDIRVLPLTPVQPVFDSVLVGNLQIGSPFEIVAIGNIDSLLEATKTIKKRKIQVYVDSPIFAKINPTDNPRELKFISAAK